MTCKCGAELVDGRCQTCTRGLVSNRDRLELIRLWVQLRRLPEVPR